MKPYTLTELRTAAAALRQQQLDLELSDDFCFTNGKMQTLIEAERNINVQIRLMEEKEAEGHVNNN